MCTCLFVRQVIHRMSTVSICDVVQQDVRQSHVSSACWEYVVVNGVVVSNHVGGRDEAAEHAEARSCLLRLWI